MRDIYLGHIRELNLSLRHLAACNANKTRSMFVLRGPDVSMLGFVLLDQTAFWNDAALARVRRPNEWPSVAPRVGLKLEH